MLQLVNTLLSSSLLFVYLETSFYLLVDLLFLDIPWLAWGTLVVLLLLRFGARLPPPDPSLVAKVLGIDPLVLEEKENDEVVINSEERNEEELEEDEDKYCIRVVAHRGAHLDYPENSLTAFRNTFLQGCDAIEFDLALTKDNIPIIFHDPTTDRLTGNLGVVRELTWNELKTYDISANHPLRSELDSDGETIALFEDVLREGLKYEARMFIDLKSAGNEIIKVVLDAFNKYPILYERAVISSFNPIIIYKIRQKDPRIIGGLAWRPQFFSMRYYCGVKGPRQSRFSNLFTHILAMIVDAIHDWAIDHVTYYILGLSFIILHKDVVSPEVVRLWNAKGVRVFAWPVNLPSEKIHFLSNLKVTFMTDTLLS